MPLFSALLPDPTGETLVAGDGDVRLYRGWLGAGAADALLAAIRERTVWIRERRKMYDRVVDVPREQAWFSEEAGVPHAGAGPWWPEFAAVRDSLEPLTAVRFRYVLVNRYRDGADSVAWHNDREVAHMARPVIASLTLGATRAFDLRPKSDRRRIVSVDLDHGDLVVMRGETQANYEHRVAKDRRVTGERINLTFRELREPGESSPIEREFDTGRTKDELR